MRRRRSGFRPDSRSGSGSWARTAHPSGSSPSVRRMRRRRSGFRPDSRSGPGFGAWTAHPAGSSRRRRPDPCFRVVRSGLSPCCSGDGSVAHRPPCLRVPPHIPLLRSRKDAGTAPPTLLQRSAVNWRWRRRRSGFRPDSRSGSGFGARTAHPSGLPLPVRLSGRSVSRRRPDPCLRVGRSGSSPHCSGDGSAARRQNCRNCWTDCPGLARSDGDRCRPGSPVGWRSRPRRLWNAGRSCLSPRRSGDGRRRCRTGSTAARSDEPRCRPGFAVRRLRRQSLTLR